MAGALPPGAWWRASGTGASTVDAVSTNGSAPGVQPYGPDAGDAAVVAARRSALELREVHFAYPLRPGSFGESCCGLDPALGHLGYALVPCRTWVRAAGVAHCPPLWPGSRGESASSSSTEIGISRAPMAYAMCGRRHGLPLAAECACLYCVLAVPSEEHQWKYGCLRCCCYQSGLCLAALPPRGSRQRLQPAHHAALALCMRCPLHSQCAVPCSTPRPGFNPAPRVGHSHCGAQRGGQEHCCSASLALLRPYLRCAATCLPLLG